MARINIRTTDLDDATVERLKLGAHARGWSIGRYIGQLVALHDAMRALADIRDAGDDADTLAQQIVGDRIAMELRALGMETRQA